ncbi:aspartate aminotransferase family protein [Siccirubricoccus sp. KC 17139]|uniref:Aspartate aminotransferase family protein n=1 Tax=Siccirubricoccus soli TaxID=2899147 RepID=A0ABT1D3Q3_9PROT|nr:aspartate aminotransferase family protein [Siccirubricoccus soli]MCO6416559.1 aspartate aminotransferase family protein [Siccirubricoccus soli]MCP2682694.1 aspartate aminotransferase family protein [Siccirubricoccus soli]
MDMPSNLSNSAPASAALYDRARRVMPGGSTRVTIWWPPHPPYAASGQGCRITDADGRVLLDFANNFFSLIHGHAHPEIVAAVTAQAARGLAFGLPTELDVALAEEICARAPALQRVRFCNSGTEAVMFAVKAARGATGRSMVAKMEGGYHGAYDPMEVSFDSGPSNWGERIPAAVPYTRGTPASVLDETLVLPFNDWPITEALIEAHAGRLAAVVLDPLPSRVGLVPGTPEYLQGIQALCRRHGIMLILDEVVCFRLHPGGAQTLFGLSPDYTALGKIIGGGQPVGAVAGTAEAMAVFDSTLGHRAIVPHGGTFSANPITMAAGLTSLRLLTPEAHARLDLLGERLRTTLARGFARDGIAAQVTGAGSLFRVHPHTRPIAGYRDALATAAEASWLKEAFGHLLAHGVLTTPNISGALSTPMTVAEIDEAADAIIAALRETA